MKLSNLYLYGTEDVPQIPREVIDGRLVLLNKTLSTLLDVPIKERDEDYNRHYREVHDAIHWWSNTK